MATKGEERTHRAWAVLAGAVAINLTMGFNYSWSIINKALVSDWRWTSLEASLPFSIYSAVYSLSMLFSGRAQDKFGPRIVATVGSIVLGAGMVACSFAVSPLLMAISYGLVVSIGNSMCYATTIPSVVKWFPPARRGLVTGTVMSALGLAAVYVAPLASWLLASYGIANTFLFLGAGAVAVILVAAQYLGNPPAGYDCHSAVDRKTVVMTSIQPGREFDWQEMVRTANFYKIWLMFFFSASAGLMILSHVATIAKIQADWENGFYLVILLAVCNTLGRIVGGTLSDRFGRIGMMKGVFFVLAANLAVFSFYVSLPLIIMGVIVTGLCYGAIITMFPLATSDFYGVKHLGVNYGLVMTAWGSAGVFGPILAGWAVDASGAYLLAYQVSAVLLLAATAIAFTVKTPARG